MQISEKIFNLLKQKGISQKEFSEQTGISQSTISDWKRKGTNPAADKILVICRTLDISPYELLADSSKKQDIQTYMIASGTQEYEFMELFHRCDEDAKKRLFGYMQALSDMNNKS